MSDYKVTECPDHIWLNYGDNERDETHAGCLSSGEVTWCEDSVFDYDVKYVRADLVEELRHKLAAALLWKEAVEHELIVVGIWNKSHENDPKKAVKDAIDWYVQVARDQ